MLYIHISNKLQVVSNVQRALKLQCQTHTSRGTMSKIYVGCGRPKVFANVVYNGFRERTNSRAFMLSVHGRIIDGNSSVL